MIRKTIKFGEEKYQIQGRKNIKYVENNKYSLLNVVQRKNLIISIDETEN